MVDMRIQPLLVQPINQLLLSRLRIQLKLSLVDLRIQLQINSPFPDFSFDCLSSSKSLYSNAVAIVPINRRLALTEQGYKTCKVPNYTRFVVVVAEHICKMWNYVSTVLAAVRTALTVDFLFFYPFTAPSSNVVADRTGLGTNEGSNEQWKKTRIERPVRSDTACLLLLGAIKGWKKRKSTLSAVRTAARTVET